MASRGTGNIVVWLRTHFAVAIYDVYKIVESIGISDELSVLIPEVRAVRAQMSVCPSAKPGVSVSDKLHEIIEKQIYRDDYEDITMGLLFIPETYDTVIQNLQKIADSGLWNKRLKIFLPFFAIFDIIVVKRAIFWEAHLDSTSFPSGGRKIYHERSAIGDMLSAIPNIAMRGLVSVEAGL